AELVRLALDLRAGLRGYRVEQLLEVALRARKLPGRHRLEDHRGHARRLQAELDVERHLRSRECKETIPGGGGRSLRPPEQTLKSHSYWTGRPISRAISARAASRFSSGG